MKTPDVDDGGNLPVPTLSSGQMKHMRSNSFDASAFGYPPHFPLRRVLSCESFGHRTSGNGLTESDNMLTSCAVEGIGRERRDRMHAQNQSMFMSIRVDSWSDSNKKTELVTMPHCHRSKSARTLGSWKVPKCRIASMLKLRSMKVATAPSDLGIECLYVPDEVLKQETSIPRPHVSLPITSAELPANCQSGRHPGKRYRSSSSSPLGFPSVHDILFSPCAKRISGRPGCSYTGPQADSGQAESRHPTEIVDAQTYFRELEGPEFDVLKNSGESSSALLVDEKWPFLLRFPINWFAVCLGLGSQSILWKTLSTASTLQFLHVSKLINLSVWCLALVALLTVFTTYTLKCIFYFEAVQREFYHPVRINFFFAPWVAGMLLVLGVPPAITRSISASILWVCFMTPIFMLELKIYGQWLSGGKRRLSRVANPSTHLSLVGNFVGALLAATIGWKEPAIFFWSVGIAHYLVLFVTLYQSLPTATVLPKQLHPVFFLFVAAPSNACIAWSKIVGDFDLVSRIAYFLGLFLYTSLVVRVNLFRGFRFSVTWWAYTFPMTASAIATIHYSLKVKHPMTQGLAVLLSGISSLTVFLLLCFTAAHIFCGYSIFPNDMAIAITSAIDGSSKYCTFRRKISDVISSMTRNNSLTGMQHR